ncbi:MAG: response regulator transcription factor [Prolixibacteraceae bacterium]|nr:response regulator transcription factor [Prolixibacteraceae bacterium]MBN2775674.1 response regulator transcription factor [Prolixibacteraceae bacterium]
MVKKVLIVEDHPIVTESLTRLISESGMGLECTHAETGKKGLACLNGSHIDIVLLDINLPDITGQEFCKIARSRFPQLKILAITSLTQRFVVDQMLQCGANGFILKTSDTSEIINAIKQVLEGEQYLGSGVRELIKGKSVESSGLPALTKREIEILMLIADGLTNQEIAAQLYISSSTVDSHRKNLLLKFNAKNTAILIKTAVSKGIIS